MSDRHAAVSLIEKDGKLLCVYNRRYEGWTLPGGLVEEGETSEQGQERELREETGLCTKSARLAWSGIHAGPEKEGRASIVDIYIVEAEGQPEPVEPGCPIHWMTRDEFLAKCPFAETYKRIFAELGS